MLSRRRLLTLGSTLLLSGCGFQPVYMRTASGKPGPAQREMAEISVGLIGDRPGQLLRQELQERLASDTPGAPHRYDLNVSYSISGEGIGIQPDTTATRVRFIAAATWNLTAQDTHAQITNGSARAMDAINVLDQQYFAADLDTEHAQRRLASEIADEIALQLAVFFRRRAGMAGSKGA